MNKALVFITLFSILFVMWPDPKTNASNRSIYDKSDSTMISYESVKADLLDYNFNKKVELSKKQLKKINSKKNTKLKIKLWQSNLAVNN